jgi:hypothetical protein
VRSLTRAGLTIPVVWAEDGEIRPAGAARADPKAACAAAAGRAARPEHAAHERASSSCSTCAPTPMLHDEVVFVLTTSDSDTDRERAYHANVAGYMVKSMVGPQFSKLAQLVQCYRTTMLFP